ncbi:MAG: hypothetical protein LBQ60_20175 [Bacteroidales bacterium]|jgi:hypothetical protein|nr:hypothetical protein [Bacteroidales bacterium]
MKNLLLLVVVLLTLSSCKKVKTYCFDCVEKQKVKISYFEKEGEEIPEGFEICDEAGEYVCYEVSGEICNETENNIKYYENAYTYSNEDGERTFSCTKKE